MVKEVWVLTKRDMEFDSDDYEDNVVGVYVEIPTIDHLMKTYNMPEKQALYLTILKVLECIGLKKLIFMNNI